MSDDYHKDRGTFTHSALKNAGWWAWNGEFNETPHLMKAWLDGELHSYDSRSKDLGTVVHLLCEGKAFEDAFLVGPCNDARTKQWKDWVKSLPEGEKRTPIKPEDIETAKAMHRNLLQHDAVMDLMARAGEHEQTVRATCRVSGLPLKCKPDFRIPGEYVVDFKTTKDPDPTSFLKQAKDLGYHRQAALYRYVIELATGKRERFFHAVVGNDKPYTAAVYEFPESALSEAHAQNMHVLRAVAMRRDWNEWTPEWAKGIVTEWEVQHG